MKKIIVLFLCLSVLCSCGVKTQEQEETEVIPQETEVEVEVKAELPFVEAEGMEILPADEEYRNPVYVYITDPDNNPIEPQEITPEQSEMTMRFYDYEVTEREDGYIYSFMMDCDVPVRVAAQATDYNWLYSIVCVYPLFFDYYTGLVYDVYDYSIPNNLIFSDPAEIKDIEGTFAYTKFEWQDEKIKIGVHQEYNMQWDPEPKQTDGDKTIYQDTSHMIKKVFIKTDKEYDGLMLGILKRGINKEINAQQRAYYARYDQLIKEAEETGKKSDELIRYEEKMENTKYLYDSYFLDEKYSKDDYYVIRISDIPKVSE